MNGNKKTMPIVYACIWTHQSAIMLGFQNCLFAGIWALIGLAFFKIKFSFFYMQVCVFCH